MSRSALTYVLLCSIGLQIILSGTISAAPVTATLPATVRPEPVPEPSPEPTPSPTPDTELDQAKRDAALADERKKKEVSEKEEAEARRDKLKAETEPFGDTTKVNVPTGSVKTDQAGFVETQMLAQEAARVITGRLTKFLCVAPKDTKGVNLDVQTLVIYNDTDIQTLALYRSLIDQLDKFIVDFNAKAGEANAVIAETDPTTAGGAAIAGAGAIAIPGIATGVIKSIAELVNLFRSDTEFQNRTVTITEDMVVSYLVDYLNNGPTVDINGTKYTCAKRPGVFYPRYYPPNLFVNPATSVLLTKLSTIEGLRANAAADVKRLDARLKEIKEIADMIKSESAKVDERTEKMQEKADTEGEMKKLGCRWRKTAKCEELKKAVDELNKQIGKLNKEIGKLDSDINTATGGAPDAFKAKSEDWKAKLELLKTLTQALIDSFDQITSKLNAADSNGELTVMAKLLGAERLASVLQDATAFTLRVSASANGTTKIKKNLFVDAKVRHSAGANLVYQLFDNTGKVVMGDTMQFYYDYKSSKAVREEVRNLNPD